MNDHTDDHTDDHTRSIPPDTLRPGGTGRRMLLLASSDRGLASFLETRLGASALVNPFKDVPALLGALDAHTFERVIVLLDCRTQPMPQSAIGSLEHVLPRGARVLLWGAPPGLVQQLRALASSTATWIPIAAEGTEEEVAWLCEVPMADPPDAAQAPAAVKGPILVVDDDATFCRATARPLEAHGYEVLIADGGMAALKLCAARSPRLILTDLEMPGMSGVQFSNAVLLALGDKAPPIVLVTGIDISEADLSVVRRVLTKPVPAALLLSTIDELMPSS